MFKCTIIVISLCTIYILQLFWGLYFKIINNFFGESVTVAGLIVGEDLIAQLKDKDLGDELLIPSVMLRFERDMFLDNVTVEEAEKALNIKITPSDSDGYKLLNLITGR